MLASGTSNQVGASLGALAFPTLGAPGVVALRQWVAGAVLLAVVRPRLRSFSRQQWWPVLLMAVVFSSMNLGLYVAIDRIGLGLAVTLEFLGPLTIALASSRRRVDAVCGVLAAVGVVILTRPQPSTDYVGIAFGLLGAACWAGYIMLSRTVGARLPGAEGPAAAAGVSGLVFLPIGIVLLMHHPPTAGALACAAAAGLLSSAVPLLVDLFALRQVPTQLFGVFMSINPVLAAVVGLLVLDQVLPVSAWASISVIVLANAISISTRRGPASGGPEQPGQDCSRDHDLAERN